MLTLILAVLTGWLAHKKNGLEAATVFLTLPAMVIDGFLLADVIIPALTGCR